MKSPKVYFVDTGLLCYLLGIRSAEELALHPLRGQIFECFIIGLLFKERLHLGLDPDFYFWRDSQGLEVDLVWERAGKLWGLEIKSGATFAPDFIQSLEKWKAIVAPTEVHCSVLYGGDQSLTCKGIPAYSWRLL
jgi:predicted AAA+ superfamily ATPase